MEFIEQIKAMSVGDLLTNIIVIVGIISVIIEKSKKLPFNPWSKLFNWIGSKITESITKKLETFEEQQNDKISNLEKQNHETRELIETMRNDFQDSIQSVRENYNSRIDQLEHDLDHKETKRLRGNIMCFADTLRKDVKNGEISYTKQHFENILRDVDDYTGYCEKRGFPNHYIDAEVEYINKTFAKLCEEGKI